ncbi:hypothetical protein D9758_014300 [Tetrapyrgos nigripes]|uniref:DUF6589 domain-containing protein n=1 Tax=Tetrapyrgos nigripes TaxID=182062 RepID=A0A8H5C6F1_9AGAR|nr:hypothetical protein D9758_014300 [Tetrapyrgos nigripes]
MDMYTLWKEGHESTESAGNLVEDETWELQEDMDMENMDADVDNMEVGVLLERVFETRMVLLVLPVGATVEKTACLPIGSNSSWEWLSMISPCVEVFRKLATNINDSCGEARQGSRHAPPDLSKDIRILMDSLREHGVYKITKRRVFDVDDSPAKDVITEGLCNLSSPLAEYNAAFKRLQRRRRQMPITGGLDPGLEEFVSSDMRESAGDELRVDVKEDVEGVEEVTDLAEDVFEGDIARAIDDEEVQTFTLDNEEDVALDMDVVEVTW